MKLQSRNVRVLVTGGTGFIGGRLVEVLASVRGVEVVALVRNFKRTARIARYGVRLRQADLLKPDSFRSALEGVDTVFHCAYGRADGEQRERELNIASTLNLAAEARRSGVRRFVHTSSMAVYGQELPDVVTEQTPYRPTTPYGRIKRDVELALRDLGRSAHLSIVIAQPTKVYGPYDFNFTVSAMRKLLDGQLWLIEGGVGLVSPAYVDNVVQGLLLCAEKQGVDGGVFILADGVTLRWADFWDHFARVARAQPFGSITHSECVHAWAAGARGSGLRGLLAATLLNEQARALYPRFALYRVLRKACPRSLTTAIKALGPPGIPSAARAQRPRPAPPSVQEYRDFMRRGSFSIERARRELGYEPRVALDAAMERTGAWLSYARIVS